MSDWRSGEPNKRKSNKPAPSLDFPEVSSKPTGGWKGKGKQPKAAPTANSPVSRTWLGDGAEAAPLTSSALRKWLAIILLASATVALVIFFTRRLSGDPKLPLFVFSVRHYEAAPELQENPYADSQRKNFIDANPGNISAHKVLNNSGDDNALTTLATDKWINTFQELNGKPLEPGGPDKQVIAFYINAYAAFTSANDLHIFSQQSNPFANDQENGLPLEDVLRNIATKIPSGSLAWVILDLQLPPSITNLDNLDPPWESAGEQALKKLDPSLVPRLLLTLPGQDGQQNWLAPEFKGSFFGHYVLQLLEGHFQDPTILDKSLTVGDFQRLLEEKVSDQVNNRRFARQNPAWLPATTVEKIASTGLVTILKTPPTTTEEPAVSKEYLESIHALWKKVNEDKHQAGYRWDPIGYARVESQLLALEEIALTRPDSFGTAKTRVEDAWSAMEKPADSFGVSLIEDKQRDLYFHRTSTNRPYQKSDDLAKRLVSKLKDSSETLPSFFSKPQAAGTTEKTSEPSEEASLSDPERPLLLWQFYAEASLGENSVTWNTIFSRDRLLNALSYISDGEKNWLEINLLRRIANDIDWELRNPDRVKACAEALHYFKRIQSLATTPEPELSWWVRSDLEPIEKQFLRGFDQLLANQAAKAIQDFNQISETLNLLESKAQRLAETIESTNETLHAIPHFLAWLTAEYQFAQEDDKNEILLRKLGHLAGLANTIYRTLESKTQVHLSDKFFDTGSELEQALEEQNQAFKTYLKTKTTGAASNNPQTFRRDCIALRTPFLSTNERKQLHSRTTDFLKSNVAEIREQKSEQQVAEQRSGRVAVEIFLEAATDPHWVTITKTDLRLTGLHPFDEATEPTHEDSLSVRSELLETEYWQRCYASSYGAYPTLHKKISNVNRGTPWPWSCAWQRWSLADANYRLWQVSRLSEASWGNGVFDTTTPSDKFYFCQLGEMYRLKSQFDDSKAFGRLANRMQTEMVSVRDEKLRRLRSLQVKFGDKIYPLPQKGGTIPIEVSGGAAWNCVGQIFININGQNGKRAPWQLDNRDDRTLVVDFSSPDKRHTRALDAELWQGSGRPLSTMAIRGNLLRTPTEWRVGDNKQIELTMKRTFNDASIWVLPPKEKPPITVLMLIDCSKSMNTMIPLRGESNENKSVKLFDLVKENAHRIIEQFGQIHGREANVKFGLIPFGLKREHLEPTLGELKNLLNMQPGDFYRTKEIKPLSEEWQIEMEQLVDKLEPSGDTPLYNAISLACSMAKPGEKTLIYVLSDGVNYLDPEEEEKAGSKTKSQKKPRISKTSADLRSAIVSNKQLRLSIFHYDFFKIWLEGEDDKTDRDFWQRTYDDGISELKGLKNEQTKEQYGYYNSSEADKLMQDSIDTIPSTKVTIQSKGALGTKEFKIVPQPLGREIKIDRVHLPSEFSVTVTGQEAEVKGDVELLGGEQLQLEFDVRGRRFTYGSFIDSGWEQQKGTPAEGNLRSKVFLKTLRENLATSNQLGFELNFWNGSTTEFTHRPQFVVAELSQTNDPKASTFVLADHRFMPQEHWPIVQLSDVPWPANGPLATLRVWASDTLPTTLKIENLDFKAARDIPLGIAKVHFEHHGSELIVTVKYDSPPAPKNRVVIICPDFESTRRVYYAQDSSETHTFVLPENLQNKPSTLQFTTIEELEKAVQAKQVTNFNFEAIDPTKP